LKVERKGKKEGRKRKRKRKRRGENEGEGEEPLFSIKAVTFREQESGHAIKIGMEALREEKSGSTSETKSSAKAPFIRNCIPFDGGLIKIPFQFNPFNKA